MNILVDEKFIEEKVEQGKLAVTGKPVGVLLQIGLSGKALQ